MIINGDALTVLKRLEDNSIHCCITSSPYYGLRKYGLPPVIYGGDKNCEHVWEEVHPPGYRKSDTNPGPLQSEGNKNRQNLTSDTCRLCGAWAGELGLEPSPEMFISHLVEIFHGVKRVLRPDGLLWTNIGDSYASNNMRHNTNDSTAALNNRSNKLDSTFRPNTYNELPSGYKAKDMLGIPWLLAFALRADGWYLRADLPWIKRNSFPQSVTDRPASSIEHVFLLAKSGDTVFWTHRDKGGTRTKPTPDYVYENQQTLKTTLEPSDNWKEMKYFCEDDNEEYALWKRRNAWKGHDYFYDHVAVLQNSSESYNKDKRPRGVIRQKVNQNTKYDRDNPQFKKQDNDGNNTHTGFNERYAQKTAESGVLPTRNFRDSDLFFKTWQGLLHNEDGEPMALVVNPRGYKGAHFACFPLSLVEPLIVASTSERGCCPTCGAPWVRIIKKDPYIYRPTTGSGNQKTDQSPEASVGLAGTGGHVAVDYETVDWKPSCDCPNNEPVPCTVLDPFGGSGATGAAAKILGRRSIIIELKKEYCELAEQRIKEGK